MQLLQFKESNRIIYFLNISDYKSEIKQWSYLLIFLLCSPFFLKAQTPVLDAYIAEGLANNLAMQREELSLTKSLEVLNEAKGKFYPDISFNADYTLAGGGRKIFFPVGDLLNPVYSTLNQMSGSDVFPQIANVEEQFLPNDFHDTKLRLIQPLFNADIYYNYKARKDLVSVQQAKKETYEKELAKEIRVAYYRYMQANEALNIFSETRTLLEEVLRVNKRLVEADKATPEIVYDAEYELSKLAEQEAVANKNLEVSRAWFNFLLNREQDDEIEVEDALKLQSLSTIDEVANLQDQALVSRKELNQIRNSISANNQLLQMRKSFHLPTVNFVADAGYQGFGYKFNGDQNYWLAQFSLRWNIFQGMQNKSRVQQQKIALQELNNQFTEVQEQIKLEVRQAQQDYLAAQKAVTAANASLQSAQSSFRINNRKFQEGQGTYISMVDSRTKFTNARFSQLIAQYTLLEKQALLNRALGI